MMTGRVLFIPGGPQGMNKVHSQLVAALSIKKTQRNEREREIERESEKESRQRDP